MTSLRIFGLPLIAALALATAAPAQAQTQSSDLSDLHDALNLTSAQAGAWSAFQASAQPDPDQAARRRAALQMIPDLHAPQRVDLTIAAMQADLTSLERRGAALKAFYATLTPEQQATFDQKTAPRSQ
jgi:protein CpxP